MVIEIEKIREQAGSNSKVRTETERDAAARIRALTQMTRLARDEASELGLKFEAYLLDMAALALSEHIKD